MPDHAAALVVQGPRPRIPLLARVTAIAKGNWWAFNAGRFDRSGKTWRRATTYLMRRTVLIAGTEAAGRPAALFRQALWNNGWDYVHLAGAAPGECYATWHIGALELAAKPWAHKLTDLTWVRSQEYGGREAAKVHALVVPLRKANRGGLPSHVLVVVHMPLDNTPQRAACWADCCGGLVDLKRDLTRRWPGVEVVIVGDFNKNLRERDEAGQVRQRLEKPLGMVTSWQDGLPHGGTHGRAVIDFALLKRSLLAACHLLRDLPDSDHRAFRFKLRR